MCTYRLGYSMYVHYVHTYCISCISKRYVGKYELKSTYISYVRMCAYVRVSTHVCTYLYIRTCEYVRKVRTHVRRDSAYKYRTYYYSDIFRTYRMCLFVRNVNVRSLYVRICTYEMYVHVCTYGMYVRCVRTVCTYSCIFMV
jgi:hypothetical protein